ANWQRWISACGARLAESGGAQRGDRRVVYRGLLFCVDLAPVGGRALLGRPQPGRVELVGERDVGGQCLRLGGRVLGYLDRGQVAIEVVDQLGVLGKLGEIRLQRDVELAAVQRGDLLRQSVAERVDRVDVLQRRVGGRLAGRRCRRVAGRGAGRDQDAAT